MLPFLDIREANRRELVNFIYYFILFIIIYDSMPFIHFIIMVINIQCLSARNIIRRTLKRNYIYKEE